MKAVIKYPHTIYMFGRALLHAQLYSTDGTNLHGDAPLSVILQYVLQNDITLTNSQEILDMVVRQQGFGA